MSCDCVYGEGEPFDEILETRADKISTGYTRCTECGEILTRGTRYTRMKAVFYEEFGTYKTCEDCQSVIKEFFCDGQIYGAIWEYLGDHVDAHDGQIASKCLESLTPRAREMVIEIIDDVLKDREDEGE